MKNKTVAIARLESICGSKVYLYSAQVGESGQIYSRLYVDFFEEVTNYEDNVVVFDNYNEAINDLATIMRYNPEFVRVDASEPLVLSALESVVEAA